jgi:hypothetical protein
MREVHVVGLNNCGLGNVLFQVANAIYYAEKYDFEIVLNSDHESILWGTSKKFGKNKCHQVNEKDVPYLETIFKHPRLKQRSLSSNNYKFVNIYNWKSANLYEVKEGDTTDLRIVELSQNKDLFEPVLCQLPKYLNLDDKVITEYLQENYQLSREENNNILLCFRKGHDFSHMTKITVASYCNALDVIFTTHSHMRECNLVVLSDVDVSQEVVCIIEYVRQNIKDVQVRKIHIINDDDITQLYAGLCCDYFVLCESTFHYWMAILHTSLYPERTCVVVFENTDLTNSNLSLDSWQRVRY